MIKSADTHHPILHVISERWSPRSFSPLEPDKSVLMRLFEAARWAPSSSNTQPWYFVVGTPENPETHEKILSSLNPNNARWAKNAPVLALAVMNALRINGKPNRWAPYDLGQAVANLAVQATAEGLYVHQMAGFNRQTAAALFHFPEGYEAMTAIAIGYLGRAEALEDDLYQKEVAPRDRKELTDFVFTGDWGNPF